MRKANTSQSWLSKKKPHLASIPEVMLNILLTHTVRFGGNVTKTCA